MKNSTVSGFLCCLLLVAASGHASNLGSPSTLIPTARLALSASYDAGGYPISNNSVPCMMNRFEGGCTFAPLSFLNLGVNAGACRVDVAGDTSVADTVGIFNGGYGFSAGMHVVLGSGFFYNDLFRFIGIAKGTYFSSKDANEVVYKGFDAAAVVGFQFRIPRFGFISLGPELYLIEGKNKDYLGRNDDYSNTSNLRGWLSVDFFPKEKIASDNKLFISLEAAFTPNVEFNKRAPMQEIRLSVGVGAITKRLYGEVSEVDWAP
jgi:hypothetical protein